MYRLITILITCLSFGASAQDATTDHDGLIKKVLKDPSKREVQNILADIRKNDLSPKSVVVHDTIPLTNGNLLFVISHNIQGRVHFGAVVTPPKQNKKK